jgi:hypothetical protein
MAKGIALNKIPGYREAISRARVTQAREREKAWKNLPVNIHGFTMRLMTVRDFVILDHFGSPFINRADATLADVAFFLWALSPQCNKWNEEIGWRKVPLLRSLESFLFTRRVVKSIRDEETLKRVITECFSYVKQIFIDAPPSNKGNGSSDITYLSSWFDFAQSEHKLTTDEVWKMPLSQLFQRIKTILIRLGAKVPHFNPIEDELKQWIQTGIAMRKFTMDDLAAGRVKFGEN